MKRPVVFEQIVAALYALGAGEQAEAEVRRSERQVTAALDDQLFMHHVSLDSMCTTAFAFFSQLKQWDAPSNMHSLHRGRTHCNDPHFHIMFSNGLCHLFSRSLGVALA